MTFQTVLQNLHRSYYNNICNNNNYYYYNNYSHPFLAEPADKRPPDPRQVASELCHCECLAPDHHHFVSAPLEPEDVAVGTELLYLHTCNYYSYQKCNKNKNKKKYKAITLADFNNFWHAPSGKKLNANDFKGPWTPKLTYTFYPFS